MTGLRIHGSTYPGPQNEQQVQPLKMGLLYTPKRKEKVFQQIHVQGANCWFQEGYNKIVYVNILGMSPTKKIYILILVLLGFFQEKLI